MARNAADYLRARGVVLAPVRDSFYRERCGSRGYVISPARAFTDLQRAARRCGTPAWISDTACDG